MKVLIVDNRDVPEDDIGVPESIKFEAGPEGNDSLEILPLLNNIDEDDPDSEVNLDNQ